MQQTTIRGGVTAAGHPATAQAASDILKEGGNAFDAAVAAMLSACVAEPVLASLGGGGFLNAKPAEADPVVYDFFAHTPIKKQPISSIDFHPIEADFGTASQTFHIGMGSIATPGFIRGLFAIHRDLCSLPMQLLMEPAIRLAKSGVRINRFQHLITRIIAPILKSTPEVFALNCSPTDSKRLINEGELHQQPELADFLDSLNREGEALFYAGEAGKSLADDAIHQGGHLRQEDLFRYQVIQRRPLVHPYRDTKVVTNPLPSLGGTLIAFALGLLESQPISSLRAGNSRHLNCLARTIGLTQRIRKEQNGELAKILEPNIREDYLQILMEGGICSRGTTQISIADRKGNLASMTLSNGEGSGYVVPGTGITLNNMLGEEDLNPGGFHHWPLNRRIASMMAPTLVFQNDGRTIVTGSGGSNRIRSAILQVLSNLIDFNMPLQQAVAHPRIHYEAGLLSLEPGIEPQVLRSLAKEFPRLQCWEAQNLFFGGAHTVTIDSKGRLSGVGDARRGGVAIDVS